MSKDHEVVQKVVKVLSEMLSSRKYEDDDELISYTQMTSTEFSEIYDQSFSNGLSFGPINNSMTDNKLVIKMIFNSTKKANIKEICKQFMDEYGESIRIIILIKDKVSTNILKELSQDKYKNVEIFQMKSLQINITKHELQPKFDIVFPNEELDIIKQYVSTKIDSSTINQFKSKLPKITKDDPISRFYGLRPGNLIKITRVNEQSGRYVMFRCCS